MYDRSMSLKYYGGAIWTNHALDRLSERGFTQEMASQTFNHPDRTIDGNEAGSKKYQKKFGKSLVTILAKQNEKSEWIILSCWMDPPLPGSVDEKKKEAHKNYQKSSSWKKIWLILKNQLGLSNY